MLAASFKRTKIVATIGPASNSPEILEELIKAGVNMVRLNFSHGTHEEHGLVIKHAREIGRRLNRPVAILADLQGPKIRVGVLPDEGLELKRGSEVTFSIHINEYVGGPIPMQHDVSRYVKPGEKVSLRDGQIEVEVAKVGQGTFDAVVITPGTLFTKQGMNLPDSDMGGDILTNKDLADLEFAAKNDADYVGLSFVQTARDIDNFRQRISELGSDMLIIAKIETKKAVENLEAIAKATDAIMVARGDLAVETRPELVPGVQRRLVELGRRYKKPVIVATQMLESMMKSPTPTRAEVSDVATAVMEAPDAVMLSGETAAGQYPVETVQMMKRVILTTEQESLTVGERRFEVGAPASGNAISAAAVVLARQLPAQVIIAETSSGQTARNVASLRPNMPIIIVTHSQRVYQQMAIIWGGKSFYANDPHGASDKVVALLKEAKNVHPGDAVVVASGHQPGVTGGTDTVQVRVVPE